MCIDLPDTSYVKTDQNHSKHLTNCAYGITAAGSPDSICHVLYSGSLCAKNKQAKNYFTN